MEISEVPLNVQEAAALLGCKEDHIRALADSGELKSFNIAVAGAKRRERRFRRSWIDEFIDRRTTVPPPTPEPRRLFSSENNLERLMPKNLRRK